MLTISQLASYAGCTVKAVRVYHERGLLPEPERDASGYRRYDAQAVIDLTRIVTVARSGVPLADIPAMLAAGDAEHRAAVQRIDAALEARIAELQERRAKLTVLRRPDRLCLPDRVVEQFDRMRAAGLSERYIAVERDSWILASAVVPNFVEEYGPIKSALLDDPEYLRVLRLYDEAIDWPADHPRIDEIVDATVELALRVVTPRETDAATRLPRDAFDAVSAFEGLDSPAWRVIGRRVEERLRPVVTLGVLTSRGRG